MSLRHLYSGATIAVGSMHNKHIAIGRPFSLQLGAVLQVPVGLDTDCYGTFTGEVERYGTMLEAARAKAELAIERSGLPYGLGSEGAFGAHPFLPATAGNTELLVFVDRKREIVIREALVTQRTNYGWFPARLGEEWSTVLAALRFPSHAVVVTPNAQLGRFEPIKGVGTRANLEQAVAIASKHSFDGCARITSDMRAHMNPTRMSVIRALAYRLARRISTKCDACGAPGFGLAELVRGLPCVACGMPTPVAMAEIHRCVVCPFERRVPFRAQRVSAEPSRCPACRAVDTL